MDKGRRIPTNARDYDYLYTMKPLLLLLILTSCSVITDQIPHDGYEIPISDKHFEGTAILKKLAVSNGFKILLQKGNVLSDQIAFKYDIYQMDTADVNRDGRTDILVGLI